MDEPPNLIMPVTYDVVWSVVVVLVIVLVATSLISIARSAKGLTASQALVWALLIIFVPIIGAVAWFAIGRRSTSNGNPDAVH